MSIQSGTTLGGSGTNLGGSTFSISNSTEGSDSLGGSLSLHSSKGNRKIRRV